MPLCKTCDTLNRLHEFYSNLTSTPGSQGNTPTSQVQLTFSSVHGGVEK